MFKVSARLFSWPVDLADHFAQDQVRFGDLYDVISGRHWLQQAVALNPFLELPMKSPPGAPAKKT